METNKQGLGKYLDQTGARIQFPMISFPIWTGCSLGALHLLGIGDRTIRHQRSAISLHFKRLRGYPDSPKNLGQHLRKKRLDLSLSMTQLAKLLGDGMTGTAIEKWENGQNYPTPSNRKRIIEFLGFDPEST